MIVLAYLDSLKGNLKKMCLIILSPEIFFYNSGNIIEYQLPHNFA